MLNKKNKMMYHFHEIDSKIVLWFTQTNKYLFFNSLFYTIFKHFNEYSVEDAKRYLVNDLQLNESLINVGYQSYKTIINNLSVTDSSQAKIPLMETVDKWYFTCTYLVYGALIKLRFSSNYVMELIHPKFEHLLVEISILPSHTIDIVHQSENLYLILNTKPVGVWPLDESHFLQGKFALQLINLCNNKVESDWMAVLHASAVYKEDKGFVFLGESGNGKSTATTLLTLNGYKLLADDFVPVEVSNNKIYSFPAAISIKEKLLNVMEGSFPQLSNSRLRYKDEHTNYKYLYPQECSKFVTSVPAKALLFIKYTKDSSTNLKSISTCEALELIIPDSWISPLPQNVPSFLNWIQEVPAYRIEYSDNTEFINLINSL